MRMAAVSGARALSSTSLLEGRVGLDRRLGQLGAAGVLRQAVDQAADVLDGGVSHFERLDDLLFGDLVRARFDHHDAVLAARDVRSRRLSLRSGKVGLTMNLPSMRPTRTPAMVFSSGISDSASAADAPVSASTSES